MHSFAARLPRLGRRRQQGVTLIEAIMGLAIMGTVFFGLAQLQVDQASELRVQTAANQMRLIKEAAERYVAENYTSIVRDLQTDNERNATDAWDHPTRGRVNFQQDMVNSGYMPAAFLDATGTALRPNPFGQAYQIHVRPQWRPSATGAPEIGGLETLVVSRPNAGRQVSREEQGQIAALIGAQGGIVCAGDTTDAGNICAGGNSIRGAYGGYQVDLGHSNYAPVLGGVNAGRGDAVAAVAFYGEGAAVNDYLYRYNIGLPQANTMFTDLLMQDETRVVFGEQFGIGRRTLGGQQQVVLQHCGPSASPTTNPPNCEPAAGGSPRHRFRFDLGHDEVEAGAAAGAASLRPSFAITSVDGTIDRLVVTAEDAGPVFTNNTRNSTVAGGYDDLIKFRDSVWMVGQVRFREPPAAGAPGDGTERGGYYWDAATAQWRFEWRDRTQWRSRDGATLMGQFDPTANGNGGQFNWNTNTQWRSRDGATAMATYDPTANGNQGQFTWEPEVNRFQNRPGRDSRTEFAQRVEFRDRSNATRMFWNAGNASGAGHSFDVSTPTFHRALLQNEGTTHQDSDMLFRDDADREVGRFDFDSNGTPGHGTTGNGYFQLQRPLYADNTTYLRNFTYWRNGNNADNRMTWNAAGDWFQNRGTSYLDGETYLRGRTRVQARMDVENQMYVSTQNVLLTDVSNTPLRNLLSNFVFKASYLRDNTQSVPKPNCPNGTPRIFLDPQNIFTGTRQTLRFLEPAPGGRQTKFATSLVQNAFFYAVDNGGSWSIRNGAQIVVEGSAYVGSRYDNYVTNMNGYRAIAQAYCYYNF